MDHGVRLFAAKDFFGSPLSDVDTMHNDVFWCLRPAAPINAYHLVLVGQ
jgi:hypothetical protein